MSLDWSSAAGLLLFATPYKALVGLGFGGAIVALLLGAGLGVARCESSRTLNPASALVDPF